MNLKIRQNLNTRSEQEKNYLSLLSHDGKKLQPRLKLLAHKVKKCYFKDPFLFK